MGNVNLCVGSVSKGSARRASARFSPAVFTAIKLHVLFAFTHATRRIYAVSIAISPSNVGRRSHGTTLPENVVSSTDQRSSFIDRRLVSLKGDQFE